MEKNHQEVLSEMTNYKQMIHTAVQSNQHSLPLATSATLTAAPSVATGILSATHLPLSFGMAGPSSTIQTPVTTAPASLTGTRPPLQPVTTAAAQTKPFHGFPAGSAAPAHMPSVTSAPAPTPSFALAPVSFFAPWLPAHTYTTNPPSIMTTRRLARPL